MPVCECGAAGEFVAWKIDSRMKLFACFAGAVSIMDDYLENRFPGESVFMLRGCRRGHG